MAIKKARAATDNAHARELLATVRGRTAPAPLSPESRADLQRRAQPRREIRNAAGELLATALHDNADTVGKKETGENREPLLSQPPRSAARSAIEQTLRWAEDELASLRARAEIT